MPQLPRAFEKFCGENPAVATAYQALDEACAKAGPLDAKTRELVKLGMAIGGRLEGAVHSHARRVLEAGATAEQVRHVVALAAPTRPSAFRPPLQPTPGSRRPSAGERAPGDRSDDAQRPGATRAL
jgi:alkylhydroperoxidase/carboxymuconolactone decarboxylase family protein YurZ